MMMMTLQMQPAVSMRTHLEDEAEWPRICTSVCIRLPDTLAVCRGVGSLGGRRPNFGSDVLYWYIS